MSVIAGGYRKGRAFVASRLPPAPDAWVLEKALPAARARALAEALAVFTLGFVLDDLRALRLPGFLVGVVAAVVVLAFGSVLHARGLARRYSGREEMAIERALARSKSLWRLAALLVLLALGVWLAATAGGLDLWPA